MNWKKERYYFNPKKLKCGDWIIVKTKQGQSLKGIYNANPQQVAYHEYGKFCGRKYEVILNRDRNEKYPKHGDFYLYSDILRMATEEEIAEAIKTRAENVTAQ